MDSTEILLKAYKAGLMDSEETHRAVGAIIRAKIQRALHDFSKETARRAKDA